MLKVYIDVKEANNGFETLDIVMKHQPNNFDAILKDINMPFIEGFMACQKINK